MTNTALENYYETVILPQYRQAVEFKTITWKDHGKIDLDAWAHYFEDENGREYVLLYEDFPGNTYLNDGLTHDIVKCGDETNIKVSISTGAVIDNVTGYFGLYQEKSDRQLRGAVAEG
jgi:hypothetical protein